MKQFLSKSDKKFLAMAMGVAATSKCRHRHGCLVVHHGTILGSSPNIFKNSPKFVDFNFSSVHSEIASLKKARWPRKATVYVARIGGVSGAEPRLSKPCANCQVVLDELKCRVVYTVSE